MSRVGGKTFKSQATTGMRSDRIGISIDHCKPPVAIMAPNFSKLVSKFWKLVSERKYALTPENMR